MKNLILILISFLFFTPLCKGHNSDSLYRVELKGKLVIPENEGSKVYKLEIIYNNVIIESSIVVDEESFLLRLIDNTQYTMRIFKEGYVPMVITLDTRLDNKGNHFHFDNDFFLNLYGFHLSLVLDKPTEYLTVR